MTSQSESEHNSAWERETLTKLAMAGLKEQQRARRWGIFFKLLAFAYLFLVLFLFAGLDYKEAALDGKHTALVDLEGLIAAGKEADADHVVEGLRTAFKDKNTAGVILRANSPGGTPVQASYIYNEIVRLREKYSDIPLYAVIADTCASGCYYVVSAADEIYADKASLIGSIGVTTSNSFGFVEAIQKLGVERRVFTAGDHKSFLDPFLPVDPQEKNHFQSVLNDIHQQFINAVKKGRGDRLAKDESLFSGLLWSGGESLKLGLVDEFGSASYVAREVIGEKKIVDFTEKRDWIERFTERIGAAIATTIETRLLQPNLQ